VRQKAGGYTGYLPLRGRSDRTRRIEKPNGRILKASPPAFGEKKIAHFLLQEGRGAEEPNHEKKKVATSPDKLTSALFSKEPRQRKFPKRLS